jgi:hypothetical protein
MDVFEQDQFVAQVAVAPVLLLDGRRTTLRELWRKARTVTTFVRHFGCLFCHQAVDDLVEHLPRILRRGARVVVVGNGSIAQARRFFDEKALPREGVDVVTDPEREAYRAADFERGLASAFLSRGSLRAFREARREGHKVTGLFGDLTQLGGTMVTDPPPKLLYVHRSRFAGDHADPDRVIEAVG